MVNKNNNKTLNIGIVAHVDAGKTSLTEQLLFQSGAIKKLGNVDKGTCISDKLELERERGISIENTSVKFTWNKTNINIIDTPGHIDFASEVDRAMDILDAVVLVISAVEGVQAHSLNLWEHIKELGIPLIIFVNKIDRDGADIERVFEDIEKEFNTKCFCINTPDDNNNIIHYTQSDITNPLTDKSYENLSDIDDSILEYYLDSRINKHPNKEDIVKQNINNLKLTPLYFGIAKEGIGISNIADAISKLEPKITLDTNNVNAKIFKIEHNDKFGKLAYIRLFSGTLKAKDQILCPRLNKLVKINLLLTNKIGKLESVLEIAENDIAIIGVSEPIISGDILGPDLEENKHKHLSEPVLSVEIEAKDESKYQQLAKALQILNIEDPSLSFEWNKEDREFIFRIMGPMQIETLTYTLQHKYNIEVDIKPPRIIYKETIVNTAEAVVRYTMPKPCWAVLKFKVEPGEVNSGIEYKSYVSFNDISRKYQNEISRAIPWSLKQGLKGWPVSDIKISLLAGEEHVMHSNPGDFLLATPMGLMNAINNAGTILLEPYYDYEIKANQQYLGAIASDLNNMKAEINQPVFDGDMFYLSGKVSVEKAMDYSIKFSATCSGKGRLKMKTGAYYPCENQEGKAKKYKGISPLDRSQWILHNRGALNADEIAR